MCLIAYKGLLPSACTPCDLSTCCPPYMSCETCGRCRSLELCKHLCDIMCILNCPVKGTLQHMTFICEVHCYNSVSGFLTRSLAVAHLSALTCTLAGVGSGSHSTYCDLCAGVGGCHCWAVWGRHGCQASVALADPPACAPHPLWTSILPSHDVSA